MATKIVTKNSSTASAVPTASDLVQGELAVNVADKRLFTEDNAGAIVELGTNPSSNVTFQDNGKAIFGAGSDLQIYHDGSSSFIKDAGTGNLIIQATDLQIANADNTANYIRAFNGGAVDLRYAGSAKLSTTSTGIDVTGTATMDGGSISGNLLVGASSASAKLTVGTFGDTARAAQFHGGSILIDGGAATDLIMGDGNVAYMSLQTTDNATAMKIRDYSGNADLVTVERASGNVGIGTSSPTLSTAWNTVLHVKSAALGAELRLADSDSGGVGDVGLSVGQYGGNSYIINKDAGGTFFWTGGTERMRIDSSGNVGIGTSSLVAKMHVKGAGTSSSTNAIFAENSSSAGLFAIRDNGDAFILGNTGIGTSSPSTALHVKSTTSVTATIEAGGGGDAVLDIKAAEASGGESIIRFSDSVSGVGFITYAQNDGGSDYMRFGTASTERMRIDSSGNLLVGTTSVSAGASSGKFVVGFAGNTANGIKVYDSYASAATNNAVVFIRGSSEVGSITTTTSATAFNTSSDQRLKENIADADDAGSKIDAIQVRKYDWKADGSHQDYGMIAQELQTVAPEAVSGDADSEEMMGVDYSKLVPMLIKEIQSLRNRVAQLEE